MSTAPRPDAELRIPADPRLLRMARVTVATLASELPFTLQDIEDLRVAVDELAAAIIDGCDRSATLDLAFSVVDDSIEVHGRVAGVGSPPELHAVAKDLLGLVADGHELTSDGEDRIFHFTKRAGTTAP